MLDPNLPADREKLRRLFRIKKNELNMMLLRGFPLDRVYLMKGDNSFVEVNMTVVLGFTFDQFLQFRAHGLFQTRLEFSSIYFNTLTRQTSLVLYLNTEPGKKVNKENFRIVELFIQSQAYHHIILISENGLNPDAIGFVQHRTAGYRIEMFDDVEFALDPLKHALSPISIRHIPNQETEAWSREEHLQPSQLPMILTSDPIAKRYGADPLDVFQMVSVGTTIDEIGRAQVVRRTPREKKR